MSLPDAAIARARIVERGDALRFRTVMAAPVQARATLFALYAFNVEVSRAPWLTEEPMIAEMRLQWWRDALEEVGQGRGRRHEVVDALGFLDADGAAVLDRLVAARRWDIYKDAFEDQAHMDAYIDQTAGHLMWTACELLGAPPEAEPAARDLAFVAGTAAFLRAVPELAEANRIPLLDGTDKGLQELALRAFDKGRRPKLGKHARPGLWPAIGALCTLDQVIRDTPAVAEARLDPGVTPFRLARTALLGRLVL